MTKRAIAPSQLMELFISVANDLGLGSDRDLASLAGATVENVANWRSGTVRELKRQKLEAIKRGISARIDALRREAGDPFADPGEGLVSLEMEEQSGPAELQRQLRDRIHYDYLGHRFLYFEPQGALAWESLIRTGYDQGTWLRGVEDCAMEWLDATHDTRGRCKGSMARALGLDAKNRAKGLDVVSLGPGEGGKEVRILHRVLDLEKERGQPLPSLTLCLADVSVALLTRAAADARAALQKRGARHARVVAACADFEEGPLSFVRRLPTERRPADEGMRIVAVLGNVFGNLRDEELFVRDKLSTLVRPGDFLWLEVGLRIDPIELDPLFPLTRENRDETAAEANRRLLLEGPYRRWEAALGRTQSRLEMRVFVREDDDSSRVPGSLNFCHDLVIAEERRTVTMLYSRRYRLEGLTSWLEQHGFAVERTKEVAGSAGRPRVAHVLARRRS